MEPSDAKSIAESLIQTFARDIEYLTINEHVADLNLPMSEADYLVDEVDRLIENAKITVEFEENR